jgi:hypothetical protein
LETEPKVLVGINWKANTEWKSKQIPPLPPEHNLITQTSATSLTSFSYGRTVDAADVCVIKLCSGGKGGICFDFHSVLYLPSNLCNIPTSLGSVSNRPIVVQHSNMDIHLVNGPVLRSIRSYHSMSHSMLSIHLYKAPRIQRKSKERRKCERDWIS